MFIIHKINFIFQLKPREKTALDYSEKLKEKFAHHPQVKRISRHRHVPRMIYTQQKELGISRAAQKRKYVKLKTYQILVCLNNGSIRMGMLS